MKSLAYAVILLTITAVTPSVRAQSTGVGGAGKRSPEIVGEVERAGAQIQLVLTNPSDTRAFQGAAKVSVGLSADAAIQLPITLGPNETRRFPLPASKTSETSGDEYSLAVYNQTGALVMYKIAPIKTTAGSERVTASKQAAPASKKSSEEVRVNARLTRNLASRDAEIPTPNQAEPLLLTFEIESDTLVKNAAFTLSAKDIGRRVDVRPPGLHARRISAGCHRASGRCAARLPDELDGQRRRRESPC